MFKMIPTMNGFVDRLMKNWTMLCTSEMPLVVVEKYVPCRSYCDRLICKPHLCIAVKAYYNETRAQECVSRRCLRHNLTYV